MTTRGNVDTSDSDKDIGLRIYPLNPLNLNGSVERTIPYVAKKNKVTERIN